MNQGIYDEPIDVDDKSICNWYHTIEVASEGLIKGQYDFLEGGHTYLGNVDLAEKRVLEIGPATGFFTFYVEKLGAEAVALDLSPDDEWDGVPYAEKGKGALWHLQASANGQR